MTNEEFLTWIADRIVNVYGESENVDFVIKLRKIATKVGRFDSIIEPKQYKFEQ